jgi:hypothetical protein
MIDRSQFSKKLLLSDEARNEDALERVIIAKKRIQSVLDRDSVCNQKTLEQKVSEQGPKPQRVDPHLVGLAIMDLIELNRLTVHHHQATGRVGWLSNPGTAAEEITKKLDLLAPLYAQISGDGFGNLTGDALEIIVWKCLDAVYTKTKRHSYQGHFEISQPKNQHGRYRRVQPPKSLNGRTSTKEPDFFQFGYDQGPLCIECKNYREWFYPHHTMLKELILKASDIAAIPVLVARRLHYTTRTNLLEPAGIIAHESLFQYYPPEFKNIAEQVKHARSLGFTDVTATEEPHPRTLRFFTDLMPKIVDHMSERWFRNQQALVAYARGEINLAQLYTEIESPAGGKWFDETPPF